MNRLSLIVALLVIPILFVLIFLIHPVPVETGQTHSAQSQVSSAPSYLYANSWGTNRPEKEEGCGSLKTINRADIFRNYDMNLTFDCKQGWRYTLHMYVYGYFGSPTLIIKSSSGTVVGTCKIDHKGEMACPFLCTGNGTYSLSVSGKGITAIYVCGGSTSKSYCDWATNPDCGSNCAKYDYCYPPYLKPVTT